MSEQQATYDTEVEQQIIDASDLRKWRIELPNLYDDSDLDPYEFRLLVHYKRVGTCTQGTKTTAIKTHMSAAQVSEKRQALRDKGFINIETVYLDEEKKTYSYRITVVDLWELNFATYSTLSPREYPRSLSVSPLHSVKQRKNPLKKEVKPKEPKEGASAKPPKASDIPELVLLRDVVGHWCKTAQREIVINAILNVNARLGRPATKDDLVPFWLAWNKVSGNEWSLVWLEWAVSGQQQRMNGKNQPVPNQQYQPTPTPEQISAAAANDWSVH